MDLAAPSIRLAPTGMRSLNPSWLFSFRCVSRTILYYTFSIPRSKGSLYTAVEKVRSRGIANLGYGFAVIRVKKNNREGTPYEGSSMQVLLSRVELERIFHMFFRTSPFARVRIAERLKATVRSSVVSDAFCRKGVYSSDVRNASDENGRKV